MLFCKIVFALVMKWGRQVNDRTEFVPMNNIKLNKIIVFVDYLQHNQIKMIEKCMNIELIAYQIDQKFS